MKSVIDPSTSIIINQDARIELYLPDAPYYSKVSLIEKDKKEAGSCGIDPSYRSKLKQTAGNFDKLMIVLKEISLSLPNENLTKFIQCINKYNEQNIKPGISV